MCTQSKKEETMPFNNVSYLWVNVMCATHLVSKVVSSRTIILTSVKEGRD